MVRRGLVVAATAWLVVVLVGATMVWAVISRAGQELVAGETGSGIGPGQVAPREPRTTGPQSPLKPRRSATPDRPRHSPGGRTDEASPDASTEPSSAGPSPSQQPPPPPDSASPPGGGGDESKTDTWSGAPGSFTVTCNGSSVTSFSATQNGGWSVEAAREAGKVEAHYHKVGGEQEVEVTATCTAGGPRFSVHSDGEGESDD